MRTSALAQPKVVPDDCRGADLVHGIEVQSRCPALKQVFAQAGDDFDAIGANAVDIVTEALQALTQPAWDLRAAVAAETCQVAVVSDGHDARNERHVEAQLLAAVQEAGI